MYECLDGSIEAKFPLLSAKWAAQPGSLCDTGLAARRHGEARGPSAENRLNVAPGPEQGKVLTLSSDCASSHGTQQLWKIYEQPILRTPCIGAHTQALRQARKSVRLLGSHVGVVGVVLAGYRVLHNHQSSLPLLLCTPSTPHYVVGGTYYMAPLLPACRDHSTDRSGLHFIFPMAPTLR